MNTRILHIAILALLCLPLRGFADDLLLQATAEKLYALLTDEQKKAATLPFDSPERKAEVFTGGQRAGIKIRTLNPEQKKLATAMLTGFTSEYGRQKAISIADQKPNNPADDQGFERYYVCYFGEALPGKSYAWRIAEHHLTIVQVEVEKGKPTTFGPILLGADPPVLWDDAEDKMLALYNAMSPDERAKATQKGKGISTAVFTGNGITVKDLAPSAKQAAQAVFDNRLSFFSDSVAAQAKAIIEANGGFDAMQIAFFGTPDKKCREGGRWDFKLAGKSFLCDYEGTRGHIHMSMKGSIEPPTTAPATAPK